MNYRITELLSSNYSILLGHASACILAILLERMLVVPKIYLKMWSIKLGIVHFCIITFFYYVLILFTGRVIFSVVMLIVLLLILVIVNNAKYKNLQEPLVFSDYDYFTDAFRFPRLYFPFLGVWGGIGITVSAFLVVLGYFKDSSIVNRFDLESGLGLSSIGILLSVIFLLLNIRVSNLLRFEPREDLNNLGLVVYIWCYFIEYLKTPHPNSKFEFLSFKKPNTNVNANANFNINVLPHLIAIQSESFFDPREWNSNIKDEVLSNFDMICKESWYSGKLSVPAFGANTIRTEFSFLTGVSPTDMKGHQFSPYQIMSRKHFELKSFVNMLKSQGYYTVCIHPYYKKFYNRDIVFDKWGFDSFLDIESFKNTDTRGAYISDEAVKEKILSVLKAKTSLPIFIFAITMENHGPMHLEKISDIEYKKFYKQDAEKKLEDYDLSVYLNHLNNADKMIKDLTTAFNNTNYPISMVFYGDHVPIMPVAYKNIGVPSGNVPYFIWGNQAFVKVCGKEIQNTHNKLLRREKHNLNIEDLAITWLRIKTLK
ncbi:MAG: LTA synthase family protein [Succinivibrionaceae bacterium]